MHLQTTAEGPSPSSRSLSEASQEPNRPGMHEQCCVHRADSLLGSDFILEGNEVFRVGCEMVALTIYYSNVY